MAKNVREWILSHNIISLNITKGDGTGDEIFCVKKH